MLNYTRAGKNQASDVEERHPPESAGSGRVRGRGGNATTPHPAAPPEAVGDGSSSLSLRVLKATDDTTSPHKTCTKWTRGQCVEALNKNLRKFIIRHGENFVGMVTFTTKDIPTLQEFYRRWHSLQRRALKRICPTEEYIAILEFQKRGAPHLHVLIAVKEDIKTGVRWHLQKGQFHPVASTLGPHLKWLFQELQEIQPAYGFGTWVSIQPIRTIDAAVSDYVSKYLWKGDPNTPEGAGRVRRVRYGHKKSMRKDGIDNQRFSWLYGRSWAWRRGMVKFAEIEARKYAERRQYGNGETEELITGISEAKIRMILGNRWVYHYRESIIKCFYMWVVCDLEKVMPESAFNQLWAQGKLNEFVPVIDEKYVLRQPDRIFEAGPGENMYRKELSLEAVDSMFYKPLALSLPEPVPPEGAELGSGNSAPGASGGKGFFSAVGPCVGEELTLDQVNEDF